MAKKAFHSAYRVEVYPRRAGDYGYMHISSHAWTAAQEREICERIAHEILRHVGKFEHDRGAVQLAHDTNYVCEHCGSRWTETSDTYNGGCCAKDEDANPDHAQGASVT